MPTKQTLKPYEYYYNFTSKQVQQLKDMKYEQALHYKILASKSLLQVLLDVNLMQRDNARITDVYVAIKFNQNLLEEIQ